VTDASGNGRKENAVRRLAGGGSAGRVALFGTFDTGNFGDCLFPPIVRQQVSQRLENVEVLAFSPTNRVPPTASYPRVYAFSELGDACEAGLSAFMIGGGALLSTEHVLFSYPEIRLLYPYSLKCWLLPAMIARACGSALILNGVGLGPFDAAYDGLARNYLGGAALAGVRDALTADYLRRLGMSPEIVPDSGILTPQLQGRAEWEASFEKLKRRFALPEKYVAVQASLFLGAELEPFAEVAAETLLHAGLPVVFVPICHHLNDLVACGIMRGIFNRRGVNTVTVGAALTSLETSAILSQAALFVGTSLHGALVTLAFGKPAVSFSSSKMKKNRAVLDVVGAAGCCVHEVSPLREKIAAVLTAGGRRHVTDFEQARGRLALFFDRACDVIGLNAGKRAQRPPRLRIWRGEVFCEGIEEDLSEVKRLSVEYCKHVPLLRRCGAFAVRNNRAASELYDRVLHWAAVRRTAGRP